MGKKFKMLPNLRFGRLVTIEPTESRKDNKVIWLCECDCGNTHLVVARNLVIGDTKSCGCLKKELLQNGLHKLETGFSAFNQLMGHYKRGAKKRNLEFKLTREQFYELTQSNCYYCDIEPKQIQKVKLGNGYYTYNGIDRIDPYKGYIINNVVPCCGSCNRAKTNKDINEFKDWITKIYSNFILKEK